MPTIIDITPVSSRTTGPSAEPKGRLGVAAERLKFRLRVMAFTLVVVASVAAVLTIGLLVFLVLLGTAAALTVVALVRSAFARRAGTQLDRRG